MSRTNRRVSRTASGAGSRRAANERIMSSRFGGVSAARPLPVVDLVRFIGDPDDPAELHAVEDPTEQTTRSREHDALAEELRVALRVGEDVQSGAVAVRKSAQVENDRLDRRGLQKASQARRDVRSRTQVELTTEPDLRRAVVAVSDLERDRIHPLNLRLRNVVQE